MKKDNKDVHYDPYDKFTKYEIEDITIETIVDEKSKIKKDTDTTIKSKNNKKKEKTK